MNPGKPLRRYARLERSTPLTGGAPLKRTPLRARSKKQEAKYRIRRGLVAELLAERPVCERCHMARSTDVHEPRMRSRGADINDRRECVCLCRDCHNHVHAHPAEATREGWLIPSWDADLAECGAHPASAACPDCTACKRCGPCGCELVAGWQQRTPA